MYNGGSPLWDMTLPPTMASLDDEFLSLLQKQMSSTNTHPLTHFQYPAQPQLDGISPPLSQDSSPSPPSNNNGESEGHQRSASGSWSAGAATRNIQSSARLHDDDHLKRKAPDSDGSDDDENGQPHHKAQHTLKNDSHSGNSTKKSTRRKSSSKDGNPDDSRLLKRKEQNRAAQRAFRERKEKHVKDLEDKVAALEAKADSQDAENESLRELLTRLQNENTALKRAGGGGSTAATSSASPPFTFTFPPAENSSPSSRSMPSSDPAAPHSASASPSDQTLNLFGQNSGSSATSSTRDSPQSFASGNIFDSFGPGDASLFGSPGPSNFSGPNVFQSTMPYTTIAANPLFTSYRDSSPGQWDSWFGANGAGNDVSITGGSSSNLDDLFGGQYEELTPFSALVPEPLLTPPSNSISPVAKHCDDEEDPTKNCPKTKGDLAQMIAASEQSTFGPAVGAGEPKKGLSQSECLEKAKCANIPMTAKSSSHIDLRVAYTHMKQHPLLTEEDIDDLCKELTAKAKCDGTRKVLEPEAVMQVAEAFQARALKKQGN